MLAIMSSFSLQQFEQENGRAYHSFRAGLYMFPCDDVECDRLDMFHAMFTKAMHDRLIQAPLSKSERTRVLDLGTGTGIWAIEMAEEYPRAEIIGTDLAEIQPPPNSKPRIKYPNLAFNIADFESEWTLGRNSFDLIHLRSALGSVSNWDALWRRVYAHLKPGGGHLEYVEIDPYPIADVDEGGVMPPRCNLLEWINLLQQATAQAGKPFAMDKDVETRLKHAGFVDIQHHRLKLPLCDWSKEKHMRALGRWYSTALIEGRALEAMTMGPFTRILGWTQPQVDEFLRHVAVDIKNKAFKAYCICHVITARRPHRG